MDSGVEGYFLLCPGMLQEAYNKSNTYNIKSLSLMGRGFFCPIVIKEYFVRQSMFT